MSTTQYLKDQLSESIDDTMFALKSVAGELTLTEFTDMLLEAMANEFDAGFVREFVAIAQNSVVWFKSDAE